MDYKRAHDNIIQKRLTVGDPIGYSESHHIVPRSFGGDNSKSNLVNLTAREHFIIHRLLAKMYPNTGMVHAVYRMACADIGTGRYKVTARTYEELRKRHSERVKNDKEAARKKSEALKGKPQSPEHIRKRVESRKLNGSSWLSEETKVKIGKSNAGKDGTWKGKTIPPEIVQKRNATRHANGNYTRSQETNRKIIAAQTGMKKKPKTEEQKAKQRKTYLVNGEIVVDNAKQFCYDNNIRYQKFISAANSGVPYKGLNISKL